LEKIFHGKNLNTALFVRANGYGGTDMYSATSHPFLRDSILNGGDVLSAEQYTQYDRKVFYPG
jgi:hypothetical protein